MPANYTLIEKITVGAAGASSVTFSGIPQTGYTDLVVKASVRSDRTGTGGDGINLTFNGSSTAVYSDRFLRGDGSAANSYSDTSAAAIYGTRATTAGATASTFSNIEFYIPNYASANYKSVSIDGVSENNGTLAYAELVAGLWSNTAAITSIGISSGSWNWVSGSTFYLYGVAKLGTTPAIQPYATGGDTIMTDGTYWYHAFKSSGTFTPTKGLSCDVLVVAGGGGGGGYGGGGGAGGLSYQTGRSVSSATTVTVGAGGAIGIPYASGASGSNSVFDTITSNGGGGGAGLSVSGVNGGSGGGGANSGTAGTATQGNTGGATGYGFAGGTGVSGPTMGGGGGGAGAVGTNGVGSTVIGNGGNGLNTWSAWASATGTGDSGYFAGGGGGGADGGTDTQSAGGLGGGGYGFVQTVKAIAGTANTGGGGGGGFSNATNWANAGGSGIVIVRYLV